MDNNAASPADWLKDELAKRKWKQADLVRESNLDSAVISNIINQKRNAGETTARAIAKALNLPVDFVFEKLGILPPKADLSPARRALLHASEGLPDSDIELAITLLEQRNDFYKKNPSTKPVK
jgi:transcriptional regulator with XRE-family HTH domain